MYISYRNIAFVLAVIVFTAMGYLISAFLFTPDLSKDDIQVAAIIKANDTPGTNGEKYVLDIEIAKSGRGHSLLYLYLHGYGGISIYDSQKNVSLRPPKSDPFANELAAATLMHGANHPSSHDIQYYGQPKMYVIPDGKGTYKSKIYFQDYSGESPLQDLRVILVHKHKFPWKDGSWAEEIRLINGLATDESKTGGIP